MFLEYRYLTSDQKLAKSLERLLRSGDIHTDQRTTTPSQTSTDVENCSMASWAMYLTNEVITNGLYIQPFEVVHMVKNHHFDDIKAHFNR